MNINKKSNSLVSVEIDGKSVWSKSSENGVSSGNSIRSKDTLEQVVNILDLSLSQAKFELTSLNNPDPITDV